MQVSVPQSEESRLKTKTTIIALASIASAAVTVAQVNSRTAPQTYSGRAETSLVGISLFDSGQRVISKYGSPFEVQALTVGGSGVGSTSGASGGGRGGPGGAGVAPAGTGAGGAAASALGNSPYIPSLIGDPFDTGVLNQNRAAGEFGVDGGGNTPTAAGAAGGGGAPSAAGAAGGSPASSGGGAGGGSLVTYTRWVYKRKASRYAFVLDKFNRVVQIEAVGAGDGYVKTRRGIGFGNTFGTIIARYNAPDGYEINGDNMIVRYLQRDRVAFRLQRLNPKAPQVVTGVVVAAGK